MDKKAITIVVMSICVIALIAWDVFVAVDGTPGDTISEIMMNFAQRHPIVGVALGIVIGHLFWPQYLSKVPSP